MFRYSCFCLFAVIVTAGNGKSVAQEVRILEAGPRQVAAGRLPDNSWPEAPPWLVTRDGWTKAYITTGWTWAAWLQPERSFLHDPDAFLLDSSYRVSAGVIHEQDRPPQDLLNPLPYWRRNYYGVFSAHLLRGQENGGDYILALLHGENKNERVWPGIYYDNTILPPRRYQPEEYSGMDPVSGEYQDQWETYFAFTGLSWCPLSDSDGNRLMGYDQGPCLWPSAGYLRDGTMVSRGLRHPSSIVHDGYLYVYYLEEFPGLDEPGRKPGIKLARALLKEATRPGSLRCWYDGGFRQPSLPQGFHRHNQDFLSVPGGRSEAIIPDYCLRFSVARLLGADSFLSVEQRIIGGDEYALFLRTSDDLVHWSQGVEVPDSRHPWPEGFHYPVFADLDFTSNTCIDPDGFYLVGSVLNAEQASPEPRVAIRRLKVRVGRVFQKRKAD
mgnify:CR=1 FL=1